MADPMTPSDATDPAAPSEPAAGIDNSEPVAPAPPSGVMVAFLPSEMELASIAQPGGLNGEDVHLTLRFWADTNDETFIESLHDAAIEIASRIQPFTAKIVGRRQLGSDTPPADVLVLDEHPAFRSARMRLPRSDKDYPSYIPHVTVGYGIGDDALAKAATDNDILVDHIAVCRGNDWMVYELGDLNPVGVDPTPDDTPDGGIVDVPLPPPADATPSAPVTAGLDDVIEGKIDAPGSRAKSRTVGKLDPRPSGSKQKCFHGSPATCKSVKWIAAYTAMREKGYSKAKAAAISNSMHRKWKAGVPNKVGQRPMIRKTI